MLPQIYLHSFQSVLPQFASDQSSINEWIIEAHSRSLSIDPQGYDTERFIPLLSRFCTSKKIISRRGHECNEIDFNWDEHEIYQVTAKTPRGADLKKRNEVFARVAQGVFDEIYQTNDLPDHLIHVTCTGYISPSAPQVYFSTKEKAPAITHAYHMGCYASLPAVRMAKALAQTATIDIVHTEVCSLHLNTSNHNPEQIVVQSLFGDGHMRYRLSMEHEGPAFRVKHIEELLVKDSLGDMTWIPGPYGMEMTLSRAVPTKIQAGIQEFLRRLCDQSKLDLQEVVRDAIFAVHPGGPKIIDAVQETLGLSEEQVSASRKILFERGNMSSATLPHVWQEILRNQERPGTIVVSLAFGPGLTMFGGVFEIVH